MIYAKLIIFRLLNSLLIQTSFVPDEHWQSVEVAYKMVYGIGHLTWEWNQSLRSIIYPGFYALIFGFLKITGLDCNLLMIQLPRIFQSVMTATGDYLLFKYTQKNYSHSIANIALFLQCTSWFTLFMSPRTLVNSIDWFFTILALYFIGTKYTFVLSVAIAPLALLNIYKNGNILTSLKIYSIVGGLHLEKIENCWFKFEPSSHDGRFQLMEGMYFLKNLSVNDNDNPSLMQI
ncbi:hypothetical protein A3Q56_01338 [Intoshia linei]|uniref:Mannosyltransferase n=1 Tax=Intoshia linei TaxID=1819745 RepID=A0A177BB96_9BILA|nr:hypothetical protein A3Q56_01338 [Intoshia linei]